MMKPRPWATPLLATAVLAAACTHSGSPARPTPTRSRPFASVPQPLSGSSPFAGCSHGPGIAVGSEVEPSLAVDPADPRHLVAAWQQDRNSRGGALGIVVATTVDGGATWRTARPPLTRCAGGPYDLASDPAVSIGPDHAAYLSAIGIRLQGSGRDVRFEGEVVASASSDQGRTWGTPVVVATSPDQRAALDKETILADPRTPGTAYAAWVRYEVPSPGRESQTNETYFSRTDDGGRTWSSPRRSFGAHTESQFHQLVALPGGAILDAFLDASTLSHPPVAARVAVIRSEDGGRTWSAATTAASLQFTTVADPTGKDHVRGTGQGILAAAAPDGAVYVCWSEPHRDATSLLAVARSDDGGRTWTGPRAIERTDVQPFIPAVAVSGDGVVGVSWYEVPQERSGGQLPAVVRFAWSTDGGAAWRTLRLAGPFDLHTADLSTDGDFVGDYEGLVGLPTGFAAVNALASPLSRSGATDVFFSRIEPGP